MFVGSTAGCSRRRCRPAASPAITRELLLELDALARPRRRRGTTSRCRGLPDVDEAFLTSSTATCSRSRSIDGRCAAAASPGPVARLAAHGVCVRRRSQAAVARSLALGRGVGRRWTTSPAVTCDARRRPSSHDELPVVRELDRGHPSTSSVPSSTRTRGRAWPTAARTASTDVVPSSSPHHVVEPLEASRPAASSRSTSCPARWFRATSRSAGARRGRPPASSTLRPSPTTTRRRRGVGPVRLGQDPASLRSDRRHRCPGHTRSFGHLSRAAHAGHRARDRVGRAPPPMAIVGKRRERAGAGAAGPTRAATRPAAPSTCGRAGPGPRSGGRPPGHALGRARRGPARMRSALVEPVSATHRTSANRVPAERSVSRHRCARQ